MLNKNRAIVPKYFNKTNLKDLEMIPSCLHRYYTFPRFPLNFDNALHKISGY